MKCHLKIVKNKYNFIRKLNPNLPIQTHDFDRVFNFQKNKKLHEKFLFIFNWMSDYFRNNNKSQLKFLFIFSLASCDVFF